MKTTRDEYTVSGNDTVPIYVTATGNNAGRPIVFVHGTSHSHCVWEKQLDSDLAEKYRLIAYDLRGHGLSARPETGYEKSETWGGDLHQVIESAGTDKVILVGWSFGGMVICDYIRHYGQDKIAGIVFANASTRLGVPGREFDIGEAYKALAPGLCSNAMSEGVDAVAQFVRLGVHRPHCLRDFYTFLGMAINASPFARSGILLRKVSNDDILKAMAVPMLLIHGVNDQIVLKSVSERHATLIPNVATAWYEETGHCSFWEQPERFNTDLAVFAGRLP